MLNRSRRTANALIHMRSPSHSHFCLFLDIGELLDIIAKSTNLPTQQIAPNFFLFLMSWSESPGSGLCIAKAFAMLKYLILITVSFGTSGRELGYGFVVIMSRIVFKELIAHSAD